MRRVNFTCLKAKTLIFPWFKCVFKGLYGIYVLTYVKNNKVKQVI